MIPEKNILWFRDISLSDRPSVGGKGGSLGELCLARIPVPDGFVVTTQAFTTYLDILDKAHGIRDTIAALDAEDVTTLNKVTADMRALVSQSSLPQALVEDITAASAALGDIPLAVRSSATSEDSEEASFAGLQDTYLWQKGRDQLLDSVRKCWARSRRP